MLSAVLAALFGILVGYIIGLEHGEQRKEAEAETDDGEPVKTHIPPPNERYERKRAYDDRKTKGGRI